MFLILLHQWVSYIFHTEIFHKQGLEISHLQRSYWILAVFQKNQKIYHSKM